MTNITRFFKALWYTITGRAHEQANKLMQNPEALRSAYEDIILEKQENIHRYKRAIEKLIAFVDHKRKSLKSLTEDIDRFEQMKADAIIEVEKTSTELKKVGKSEEEIEQHPDYLLSVISYNDFHAALEEKNARVAELERDIGREVKDIESHQLQITILHRDLEKIKTQQTEAIAALITTREQEEIADMLSGISPVDASEQLTRMQEIREKEIKRLKALMAQKHAKKEGNVTDIKGTSHTS
ncbi:MAG: hypothetical protein OXI67_07990 [Candidatus Poribacteria bacterium]|nr:hypothetical protein [Candidatus Poribacteria bacterium]